MTKILHRLSEDFADDLPATRDRMKAGLTDALARYGVPRDGIRFTESYHPQTMRRVMFAEGEGETIEMTADRERRLAEERAKSEHETMLRAAAKIEDLTKAEIVAPAGAAPNEETDKPLFPSAPPTETTPAETAPMETAPDAAKAAKAGKTPR